MAQSPLNLNLASSAASITESILSNAHPTSSATDRARNLPHFQQWTGGESGRKYPVVDGKYFDGMTGKVVTLGPGDRWSTSGPPNLEVYWQNLGSSSPGKAPFCAAFKSSALSMTEYVIQVGKFLDECNCHLRSLTATTYSVNVVFYGELTQDDMRFLWKKYGL